MFFIQFLLVIFFLYALTRVVSRWRAGEIDWLGTGCWIIFWLAAIAVVIRPDSSAYFAKVFGIGRGADLVIYSVLSLLSFLMFGLTVKMEKINRNITKLTRKIALIESNTDKK